MCYCYDVYYAHVTKLGMADLGLECVEVWVLGRGGGRPNLLCVDPGDVWICATSFC
jgi:hypothetical protein